MKRPGTLNEAYTNLHEAFGVFKDELFKPIRKALLRLIIKVGK